LLQPGIRELSPCPGYATILNAATLISFNRERVSVWVGRRPGGILVEERQHPKGAAFKMHLGCANIDQNIKAKLYKYFLCSTQFVG